MQVKENVSGDTVAILKALADSTRFEIVRQLACQKYGASCQNVLSDFTLSQPAMSHHLSKLVEAGVVHANKVGVEKHYQLNDSLLKANGINIKQLAEGAKT